jgi:hypothetical protein
MAKLSDPVLTNIFTLQRQIIECIDATTAMEFRIVDQEGETNETLSELEELQSIRERLLSPYSRLHTLVLKAAESQPVASRDVLNLLDKSITSTEAALDGSIASLQEIQRNWSY